MQESVELLLRLRKVQPKQCVQPLGKLLKECLVRPLEELVAAEQLLYALKALLLDKKRQPV